MSNNCNAMDSVIFFRVRENCRTLFFFFFACHMKRRLFPIPHINCIDISNMNFNKNFWWLADLLFQGRIIYEFDVIQIHSQRQSNYFVWLWRYSSQRFVCVLVWRLHVLRHTQLVSLRSQRKKRIYCEGKTAFATRSMWPKALLLLLLLLLCYCMCESGALCVVMFCRRNVVSCAIVFVRIVRCFVQEKQFYPCTLKNAYIRGIRTCIVYILASYLYVV